MRGATNSDTSWHNLIDISIHAPRAGSDGKDSVAMAYLVGISIHAPRAGSDKTGKEFYVIEHISIHAPRAGSDGA